jgi:hypothetical protein
MPPPRKKIDEHKLYEQYVIQQKSTTEIAKDSESLLGIKVSSALVYWSLVRYNIPIRNKSQSISMARCTLDRNETYIDEATIEWIDGFLLGDGSIGFRKNDFMNARFSMGSVERGWTIYAVSGLKKYQLSKPKQSGEVCTRRPNRSWLSYSLTHPDIVQQAKRWYPNGKKVVPDDVRITPTSLLLWYLGDGSFCYDPEHNIPHLRLATCAFSPTDIENILIPKLAALGLVCSREKSKNDIGILAESIGRFFEIVGPKSPIPCYSHKFSIPEWLSQIHLCQIVKNDREKWRAIYYIKNGQVECSKSPGGHFLLFTKDQADALCRKLGR